MPGVLESEKVVNNENCKAILDDSQQVLIGSFGAKTMLLRWFSHAGFKKLSRPKNLIKIKKQFMS